MTAQAMDTVLWQGRTWALVGVDGAGLFTPQALGINPVMLHTAAWRGFICGYRVGEDRLTLERLEIGFDHETHERAAAGDAPLIDGVGPTQHGGGHAWSYAGLAMPVEFTGGLELGDRFIRELYVHMGFAPAWKFEEVHELRFDAGRLLSAADRSAEMRAARERLAGEPPSPSRASGVDRISGWIRGTFARRSGASRPRDPWRRDG